MKKGIQPSGMATRQKILSASLKIFLEKGYEGTTAKEVAQLAEIVNGSPFFQFGNKEGVLLELVKQIFSRQFQVSQDYLGPNAGPLLLYAAHTGLQFHITELSAPLRELYVMAYTLKSTAEFIYQDMTPRLIRTFESYLPDAQPKNFYELGIASAGIARGYMDRPCDLYFTLEQKLRLYYACCFKLYEVPPEHYLPVIEQALALDLHGLAEKFVQDAITQSDAGFQAAMAH